MFWRDFPTKKAARIAIQQIVNSQPFKQPFECPLISDLIQERHYFCSLHNLRPSRFRKIPSYAAYSFEGDFSGNSTEPNIGWHPVSWTKCLIPPQTGWDRIVRAMRDRCEPIKLSHRAAHPVCEDCGFENSCEVHHKSHSFLAIAEEIRSKVLESEISDCLSGWNWFLKDNFALPEEHRITKLFDVLHRSVTLQALCRACHNRTKRKSIDEIWR
jgi:hypothetical protein